MVPRQHKQQRQSHLWGGFSASGELAWSLLPYNATPVLAWSPSQQLQNSLSSKQLTTFLFCAKIRFREKFSILAQIVISTPCISWQCMAVSSQLIARVVASGWVPIIYTRVARAANNWFQGTPPAAAPLNQALCRSNTLKLFFIDWSGFFLRAFLVWCRRKIQRKYLSQSATIQIQ